MAQMLKKEATDFGC